MGQYVDVQLKFRCQTFSEEGSNEQFVFTSFSGNPRAQLLIGTCIPCIRGILCSEPDIWTGIANIWLPSKHHHHHLEGHFFANVLHQASNLGIYVP